jgi:hypothetical protein
MMRQPPACDIQQATEVMAVIQMASWSKKELFKMNRFTQNIVRHLGMLTLMVVAAGLLGACGSPTSSRGQTPDPDMSSLSENMVRNAQYTLPDVGTFQLKAGSYGQKYGEGATQVSQVIFVTAAFGDLNGDGAQDAAVVLTEQMGGSGSFTYLAAMLNKNGVPKQAAMTQLGDRTQIKSLAVRDGQVVVDLLTHGPNDPMCCPSQLVTRTYAVAEQALKVVGNVVISSPSATSTPGPSPTPIGQTPPKPVSAARSDKDLSFEIEGSSDKCVA